MKTHNCHRLPALPKGGVLLGRGRLTWYGEERRSDRYGAVFLLAHGDSTTPTCIPAPLYIPKMEHGTLMARVIEARESTHIGDIARGIYPRTPREGDILILGTGTIFEETKHCKSADDFVQVGLQPDNLLQRTNWMHPRALYDCHESVVELIFVPTTAESREKL